MGALIALKPLITLNTDFNPPACILDLPPRFSQAGIKEQLCGQQYLLWQRMMSVCLSVCRALLLWFGCLSIQLQRRTLDIPWGCVDYASRFLWIWVAQCKNNAFLEKGYLVGQNGRHRFLHTLTDLQLSSQSRAFCIESGCFSTTWQK